MGFMDSVKAFLHSVTTEDHYALYGSPYAHSTAGTTVLNPLNDSQSNSLANSRNGSSTNIGGYRPGMRSSSTNINMIGGNGSSTTIHEMLNMSSTGQVPIPSVDSLWARLERFLENEYPELEDALNSGVLTADLNEFEKDLAAGQLSVEIRQFYKRHDGQFRGSKPTGIIMGMPLLDMEGIMEEYTLWSKVAERVEKEYMTLKHQQAQLERAAADASGASSSAGLSVDPALSERIANNYLLHQKSVPLDAVQLAYVHRGWIPISKDLAGNVLAIDLAPGNAGVRGQIILFGRDFDTKVVVASSLQELLFMLVTDLEAGKYQIDKSESYEDDGYLDSSRVDDYMIGDEDEDNGELMFFDRDGTEFAGLKGKISYFEVLKRRALKRHGVAHADHFQTAFTPRFIPKRKPAQAAAAAASPDVTKDGGKLSREGSATDLLKETLIDSTPSKKVPTAGPLKLRNVQLNEEPATPDTTNQLSNSLGAAVDETVPNLSDEPKEVALAEQPEEEAVQEEPKKEAPVDKTEALVAEP